jgi:hypothetical protein
MQLAIPANYSVTPRVIRLYLDPSGTLTSVMVEWGLTSSAGGPLLTGSTYHLPSQKERIERWLGDGVTTQFTTRLPVYNGTAGIGTVEVNGSPVTSGWTATANADGTVTITFTTPPPAPSTSTSGPIMGNVTAVCQSGPSLANAAGSVISTLGLVAGTGTVYQGTGQPSTSHQQVTDVAGLLRAWASARITADEF